MGKRMWVVVAAVALVMPGVWAMHAVAEDKVPAPTGNIWEVVPNPPGVVKPWWIDADKEGRLYVASWEGGFHMSTDFGKTWSAINGNALHPSGFTINVDPNTGNLIASGNLLPAEPDPKKKEAQYWSSSDRGKTWTRMEGYIGVTTGANDGVCFLANGDILFGGFWGPSPCVFCSTDHGKTCKKAEGAGCSAAFSIGYNPVTKECWMGSESDGKAVFRSTDLGRSWVHVPTPTGLKDALADAMHVAFNDAGDVFFETMAGVYRSKDQGAKWEEVYNSGSDAGRAGCLRKDPNGYLYAGNGIRWRKNPPIARSTKNGDKGTWEDFSSGIPFEHHATSIVYNPGDGRMYCVCKDDKATPKTSRIYRTTEPVFKPKQ